jgi:hypothetical protein
VTKNFTNAPRFLLGATLVFWGWQSDFLAVGAILAVLIEAANWTKIRWEVSDEDFSRIWTFCALLLLTAAVYSFTANDAPSELLGFLQDPNWRTQRDAGYSGSRAVAALIRWLPMIFFPFVAAAAYSAREGVPLHTISLILRRRWAKARKEGVTPESYPSVRISYPYFGLCLFAASVHENGESDYFWGLCVLLMWGLWPRRSQRFALPVWAAAMCVAIGLGYAGQQGLTQLQHYLNTLNPFGFFARAPRYGFNPRQAHTMIGYVGRLKESGNIVIRVASAESARPPSLLRLASYSGYRSNVWYTSRADFEGINEDTNKTTWVLIPGKNLVTPVNIACYLSGGQGLLPLPRGTARLENLPAFILRRNNLGAVHAEGPGLVIFDAWHGPGATIDSGPVNAEDVQGIPEAETAALDKVIAELSLRGKTPQQAMQALQSFFATRFTYRLWQDRVEGSTTNETALGHFLHTSRSGHCEYFATATVLLLRRLGIPARYAVGYAVHESNGKNSFVVRQRDAHAWAQVYHHGTWHELDTTPGTWMKAERQRASAFQWLSDFWSRLMFEIAKIRYGQTHLRTYILWSLLPVLLLLAFQIFRRWRRRASDGVEANAALAWPGWDSEFYRLEKQLEERGIRRREDEPLSNWLSRAAESAGVQSDQDLLREVLRLHYRYRFDPQGLLPSERMALRDKVALCVAGLSKHKPPKGSSAQA